MGGRARRARQLEPAVREADFENPPSIISQQARIEIDPEWVKILDFQTRFPKAIEDAVGRGSQRA
jgi:hypothetical protein